MDLMNSGHPREPWRRLDAEATAIDEIDADI